jgi:hypothetical protein
MQTIIDNKAAILAGLLALSELLALIPGIKANSVFQLLTGWLKKSK